MYRGALRAALAQARARGERPLLFTPGPLSTSPAVKAAMQKDYGSRDAKFVATVREVRAELLKGVDDASDFTSILLQGSGSMGIEAVVGSSTPPGGKFLVAQNGKYGERMVDICRRLGIETVVLAGDENKIVDPERLADALRTNQGVTNIGVVHCETTSGIINDIEAVAAVRRAVSPKAQFFVDSMSAFGAVACPVRAWGADFLVTSSNKCIQGVPGFSVVIANRATLEKCKGFARSYTLDLNRQWEGLEKTGQFNNTPPVHVIMAFRQALREWEAEGGWKGRGRRYAENRDLLVQGLKELGFKMYLREDSDSFGYIITTIMQPANHRNWNFEKFYSKVSDKGFVLYPGKLTDVPTFRVGSIGEVYSEDMVALLKTFKEVLAEMNVDLKQN